MGAKPLFQAPKVRPIKCSLFAHTKLLCLNARLTNFFNTMGNSANYLQAAIDFEDENSIGRRELVLSN